jgi:predicted nucleic acid-binding protein
MRLQICIDEDLDDALAFRARRTHTSKAAEREARAWLRRHEERVDSFIDATSFAVMHRERLGEPLAFDGDFTAASFFEVRPQEPHPGKESI